MSPPGAAVPAVTVRRATPAQWRAARDVRLAALADAPQAFAATLAAESGLDEREWRRRVDPGVCLLAWSDGRAIGMVAVRPGDARPDECHLLGMWVAPGHRRAGVGADLLAGACGWARAVGARTVTLWVADPNLAAHRLYRRAGFRGTGERQPLPSDPSVGEERLRLVLAAARQVPDA